MFSGLPVWVVGGRGVSAPADGADVADTGAGTEVESGGGLGDEGGCPAGGETVEDGEAMWSRQTVVRQ
jgi:hypothetical protein